MASPEYLSYERRLSQNALNNGVGILLTYLESSLKQSSGYQSVLEQALAIGSSGFVGGGKGEYCYALINGSNSSSSHARFFSNNQQVEFHYSRNVFRSDGGKITEVWSLSRESEHVTLLKETRDGIQTSQFRHELLGDPFCIKRDTVNAGGKIMEFFESLKAA